MNEGRTLSNENCTGNCATRSTTVIVAWKGLSRRSELLSKALDAKIWFFPDNPPYLRAFLDMFHKTLNEKPEIVIVQLPQGPLLFEALLLRKLTKCKIVADVHTGFLILSSWKGLLLNSPFVRFLNRVDLIILHNEIELNLIHPHLREKAIVVFDPWYLIADVSESGEKIENNYVVFPSSFAPDEPLEEVIESLKASSIDVKIYVTGNWKRRPEILRYTSKKIIFTGYLPAKDYYRLISNAAGIITGTKREYTSLMSAWEAVAYAKPLALTETKTLKSIFRDYAIFYNWRESESIINAIKTILSSKPNMLAREKLKLHTLKSVEKLKHKLETLH